MYQTRLKVITMISLLVFVQGCSYLEPEPKPQAHELAPVLPPPGAGPLGRESLYISPISAHGPYATRQMAYRERPYEIAYFSRNVWAAEPAALIEPWLHQTLEQSDLFGAVVSGAGAPHTRYRLDMDLLILRHEFDLSPSQIHLVARVQLIDLEQRLLLDSVRFDLTEAAPENDAYGGVVATNKLVATLLVGIRAFCADILDRQ